MPENEFEKQVQQKMSELQFVPSATAWEKVENKIADKKKRRRVLVWLPLFFLLLGGMTWYYYMNQKPDRSTSDLVIKTVAAHAEKQVAMERNDAGIKTNHKNGLVPTSTDANGLLSHNTTAKNNRSAFQKKLSLNKAAHNQTLSSKNNLATPFQKAPAGVKSIGGTALARYHFQNKNAPVHHTANMVKNNRQATENFEATTKTVTGAAALDSTKRANRDETLAPDRMTSDSANSPQAQFSNQSMIVVKPFSGDSSKRLPAKDTIANLAKSKPANHTTRKKYEWGFGVTAGSSQISAGFPGITSTRINTLTYSSALQSNGGNISSGNISYTSPSAIHSHFAWSAAVVVKKPIGRTWRLNTGINYYSYATGIMLGAKIADTTGANRVVYRNGRFADYTNRIHFIELPLTIEKQLGVRSRFSLNAGIGFAVLAGTNQLRFDQQANLYYGDRGIVRQTQWSLLLGLHYRLLQKSVHLETGPVLNYHLTSTFNKDIYGNGHWLFAGIRASIFFDKRKK